MRRHIHLFRTLFIVFATLALLVSAVVWIVNRPQALRYALSVVNLRGEWRLDAKKFSWRPLKSEIEIEGFSVFKSEGQRGLSVGDIRLNYRLMGLVRARFVIDRIFLSDVHGEFPKDHISQGHRGQSFVSLLFLKNIEIGEARIDNTSVSFGGGTTLVANQILLSLNPTLFSDTNLSVNTDGLAIFKGESKIVSAAQFKLKTSTNLSRWGAIFPYLNDLRGEVGVRGMGYQDLRAEVLDARISLLDRNLDLSDLALTTGGRALAGNLNVNILDRRFNLQIDIPNPIELPYLIRPMETVVTAGAISGKIKLKGSEFSLDKTHGEGRIDISYRFNASPQAPVSVASDITWEKGAIRISKADVRAGTDALAASATIDFLHKVFELHAEGRNFPIEHVFNKFRDPHLAKIFGPSDFQGTVKGWGKKFIAKVSGTTFSGGWRPISAERIDTELEATYDYLKLDGTVFSGPRQTGKADLTVRFGPKLSEAPRTKTIQFEAHLSDHPLEVSLAAFGLKGQGAGHITIVGPHTSFKGQAHGTIEDGSWHSFPFQNVATNMAISKRQVVFSDMSVKLPNLNTQALTGNLTGDILDGKFRLHGNPAGGLLIDTTYRYSDGLWLISQIVWDDPDFIGNRLVLSGNVSRSLALKLEGQAEIGRFVFALPFMKSGKGSVGINARIYGAPASPEVRGDVVLHKNTFAPRGAAIVMDNLDGTLKFDGSRIHFDGVSADIDDGRIYLSGHVDHRNFELAASALKLDAHAMRYRSTDRWLTLEFDGALKLTGPFPNPLLEGDLTILDGKYTKDFTIAGMISGGKSKRLKSERKDAISFNPRLNLHIMTSGDLAIRNNAGDIWLNLNCAVGGTRKDPLVTGSIDTSDGRIHYLGMEFDITNGFIEFRERYSEPYLEVHAQKEIGLYNTSLILYGSTNNLSLDLSASSPSGFLEKRDVISLIMFGTTERERTEAARRAGDTIVVSVAGQVASGIIGGPVMKLTGLDVFRLEAGQAGTSNISRVYLGKQLSDRLTVNFATDVNTENAIQTIVGEYQITDNLLISGSRSSDSNYRVGGTLRFRLR